MTTYKKFESIFALGSVVLFLVGCGGSGDAATAAPTPPTTTAPVVTPPVAPTFLTVGTMAKAAGFNGDGLTMDKNGNVFVGTSKGGTIFRVTPAGQVSLFATFPTGSTANGSDFDSKGNLYVANEALNIVHKIAPDGTVSNFATGLDGPAGIFVDENDNVIVSMYGDLATKATGAKVVKIAQDKTITTVASGNGLLNVVGIAGDGKGRYFAANFKNGELFEITGGTVKPIHPGGFRLNHMKYADGYLYFPSPLDHTILRLKLEDGKLEQIAGVKATATSVDGPVATASFARPNSIDMSADGKTLYVLEFDTGNVRTIAAAK